MAQHLRDRDHPAHRGQRLAALAAYLAKLVDALRC
jgi:hypothetical protein